MADILIVEDDPGFGELLLMHLEDQGHTVRLAGSIAEGREQFQLAVPDAVLLDQQLPDGLGTQLLEAFTGMADHPPVIIITGVSDTRLVIEAMQRGAYDFIRKPLEPLELDTRLGNALRQHRLSRQVAASASQTLEAGPDAIVGTSPAIIEILKTVGRVADSGACCLITGDSGTGKEVIARALHRHSGRTGPFLAINCSAIVDTLLESELFGHEKGAFTGADARKAGKFEIASDGTLFLDEIGELQPAMQAKLLRVLQEGRFQRVGGNQELRTGARIVAATHRDLQAMVREGSFREDLYYRLNVIRLHLPPLRERTEDLAPLVEHLLGRIARRLHRPVPRLSEAAWRELRDYPWPGNVRELENVLTRATVLAPDNILTPDLLGLSATAAPASVGDEQPEEVELISLDDVEARHVRAILEHTRWHKGRACGILGISRPALDRKIAKYGLG